jgi:acetolactate synthase-1/2/3 large subunit
MAARPVAHAAEQEKRAPIAAEAFLAALSAHGVDYFFVNPGTDFPPIVEAYERAQRGNAKVPQPVLVPHENLAVAMAHGAYLMTGRAQAVMVHVNVGTANTLNNIANLARDRAPVIVAAGRTPITEKGTFGSRSRPIHWAQEMFDQAGMVRELVKWDYELRTPGQIVDVVARAHEMTMSSPRGPVYLVLPREPLSAPLAETAPSAPRVLPARPHPDPHAIETLAQWIAAAERPLIVTSAAGEARAVAALATIAERHAIPVVAQNARVMALPTQHPMHFGFDSSGMIADADLVLVIECDVPWYPSLHEPPADCRVAHVGEEPLYQRYPMRTFRSDLAIAAGAAETLEALERTLRKQAGANAKTGARRSRLAERMQARRARIAKDGEPAPDRITPQHLSRAIGEMAGPDAIIFNEYPLVADLCPRERPGTFFAASPAGGLGWGLGAALGAKLAAPEKFIVATLGDGVYQFSNPTVCSWIGAKFGLPVLTIVFNNSRYGAVRRATLSMFKDGAAGENDGRFLADLDPSPPYDEIMRAQGGFGERVEKPADLAGALARASKAVVNERRQALLNVICPY